MFTMCGKSVHLLAHASICGARVCLYPNVSLCAYMCVNTVCYDKKEKCNYENYYYFPKCL